MILIVSATSDFTTAQPITSQIVAPVKSTSPVEIDSILYCSVTADPAPTIDQPLVVDRGLSLT